MNIASKFSADEAYGIGTVLAFGGDKDVTRAGGNSTSICGVVTDKADLILNNSLSGTNVVVAAVIGRVKCEVFGPINKGDVLIIGPSGCPQSVNITYDYLTDPQGPGTIIGRAMADCDGGFHTIDIFINAA
jgi:hypothetical protein